MESKRFKVRALEDLDFATIKKGDILDAEEADALFDSEGCFRVFRNNQVYTYYKRRFEKVKEKVKTLFGGKTVYLKDGPGANNKALKLVMESQGYEFDKESVPYLNHNSIVVNFYNRESDSFCTASKSAYAPLVEKTLEEFIAEIFAEKMDYKVLETRVGPSSVTVHKNGDVVVGCRTTNVELAKEIVEVHKELNA